MQYIGTGPFKVKSFSPGTQSTFIRYDGYWQSGMPYLDEIVVNVRSDAQAMIADLSALGEAVAPLAGNSQLCYIAAARQAVAINLGTPGGFPYPLLASTSLAQGTVICVAVNAVVSATGALPQMLTSVAEFYEEDVSNSVTAALSLIEPAIMVFMGLFVGFVLISLYLPIFSLADNLKG